MLLAGEDLPVLIILNGRTTVLNGRTTVLSDKLKPHRLLGFHDVLHQSEDGVDTFLSVSNLRHLAQLFVEGVGGSIADDRLRYAHHRLGERPFAASLDRPTASQQPGKPHFIDGSYSE